MRVLWFSNTPSLASAFLNDNKVIIGWIASLEKEVAKVEVIELGVAFHYGYSDKKQFSIGKTKYFSFPFPIISKGHKRGILSRWKHKIEPVNVIDNYLEVVQSFKPDLIHIFGTENSFGSVIDKVNVPVIIQIQGNLSVYEKKWFSGLNKCTILRYSSIKAFLFGYGIWHLYYQFKKRSIREQESMKKCTYFIGRTDWDRRITRVMSPKSTYFHCDELLREDFLKSRIWVKPNNSQIIVHTTVSSVVYKGIEIIIEIAEIIKKNNLLPIHWYIAGLNGKEEVIKIIEKSFSVKFDDSGIKFLGKLKPNELVEALLKTDCYVHTSHIENSPNSVCEAMILGVPVVATYAGGTSSLITDNLDGLLVQDGDPYSMLGAIYELCQNDLLYNKISKNAVVRAKNRHNPDKVINDLSFIYKSVQKPFFT